MLVKEGTTLQMCNGPGLRLHFAFIKPEQFNIGATGKLDCRKLGRDVIDHVLPCDVRGDCDGGEDEERCDYYHADCGAGELEI